QCRCTPFAIRIGKEDVDKLAAHYLVTCTAELGAGARIPFGDATRLVHLDEAIERGVDDTARHALAFLQRQVAGTTRGHVARDLGKTDQLAVIQDRVDDHVGPETRAVLAYAPTLRAIAAVPRGNFQGPPRYASLALLGGIEHGKVMAQHVLRGITLDALRTGVPGDDVAIDVEHVDGVVDDAPNQQGKRRGRHGLAQLLGHTAVEAAASAMRRFTRVKADLGFLVVHSCPRIGHKST